MNHKPFVRQALRMFATTFYPTSCQGYLLLHPSAQCISILHNFKLPAHALDSPSGLYLILCLFQTSVFQSFLSGSNPWVTHIKTTAPPNLRFSEKQKRKKTNTEKRNGRRGELMMNIDQVFPERSLQRQMAALCCSANVPYHNRFWFSSSISFILGVTH